MPLFIFSNTKNLQKFAFLEQIAFLALIALFYLAGFTFINNGIEATNQKSHIFSAQQIIDSTRYYSIQRAGHFQEVDSDNSLSFMDVTLQELVDQDYIQIDNGNFLSTNQQLNTVYNLNESQVRIINHENNYYYQVKLVSSHSDQIILDTTTKISLQALQQMKNIHNVTRDDVTLPTDDL